MKYNLLFCVIIALTQAQKESKLVNIKQGPVKGYKDPDFDVFCFYGIPYATTPTGADRFKVSNL